MHVTVDEYKALVREQWSEAEFTRHVIELAHTYHYRVAHFRPGMKADGTWRTAVQGDGAGFPDVVLVRGPTLIAAELKVKNNKPTPMQLLWLSWLAATGAKTFIWRPRDWEEIKVVLECKSGVCDG
jgi:hypothetical protein